MANLAPIRQLPRPSLLRALRKRLLQEGGSHVIPRYDPDIERLLARGRLCSRRGALLVPGVPHDCHENAGRYWLMDTERRAIWTGYTLGEDGSWYQHSWVVEDGRIIESTRLREKYFGVRLDPIEAGAFAAGNVLEVRNHIEFLKRHNYFL